MKRMENERDDRVDAVGNVMVMEESLWNMNVILVDVKNERLGQIMPTIVRVMDMGGKHRMNNVMIVKDEVINDESRDLRVFLSFLFL